MTTRKQLPEATEYNAYEAVRTAEIQANLHTGRPMFSSALLAAQDARGQFNLGDWRCARDRALDSLSYSVGKFSPVYQACADRGPCR